MGLGTDGRVEDEHRIKVNTHQLFDQLLKCNGGTRGLQGGGFNQLKVGVRERDLLLGCKRQEGSFEADTNPSVALLISCLKAKGGLEADVW